MSASVSRRAVVTGLAVTAGVAAAHAVAWTAPAQAEPLRTAFGRLAARPAGGVLDTVVFGDSASEVAHGFDGALSDVIPGALGQAARVLNPQAQPNWWGGTAKFTLAVHPSEITYVTLKLWGGDKAGAADDTQDWRMQLFVDGASVGWYDEGPIDNADQIGPEPRSPGRFFLHTLPLPAAVTQGKTKLELEIRSMGRIWDYGDATTFFPNDMVTPSRGIYRAYSHTDPYFTPATDDAMGSAPADTVRSNDDATWLGQVRDRVMREQQTLLYGGGAYTMDAWGFNSLAEGYAWKDSPASQNPDALSAICAAIDGRYNAWKADPTVLTGSDQQWQGFGRVGLTLAYLWEELQTELGKNVTTGYTTLVNPGFEAGDDQPLGWSMPGWAANGTFTRDTTVAHSGKASVKLVAGSSGLFVVSPIGTTLVGSGLFSFSAWAKTDGTASTPYVDVIFYDSSGKLAGTDHNFFVKTGTSDWQEITGSFVVPAGAASFQIWLRAGNGETVWFDDLSFTAPDPENLTLFNPGFETGDAKPLGWDALGWAANGSVSRDTSVAHSGAASIKLVADPSGAFVVGPTGSTKVGAGQFSFSAWAKTDGSATTPHVDVLFFDSAGNVAGTDNNFFVTTGSSDWQEITGSFAVPAGAATFQMWLRAGNGETVWFDDLSFTAPPPPSAAIGRRAAYTDMLLSSRTYWAANMRHYTNQAQITAIGIYQANRGLSLISPADAWPEARAREWLSESIGLKPWLGPELADGTRTKPLGTQYYVVTPQGLTRELGFVGSYGEVQDWLVMMYESVTRGYNAVQAPELRQQMIRMAKARGYFRHFDVDPDGNRTCRLETVIGWRNEVFPGEITYGSRTWWDGNPVMTAAAFDDPDLTGWAQQMMADNQFGPQLSLMLTNTSTRVGLNATRMLARDLPTFTAQKPSKKRLPVDWEEADFVFSDETAGAVVIKNGKELLFASTYWRARQAVNNWGRVHLVTPDRQRSATIREATAGALSSKTFTVQDWVTQDYAINNSGQPSGVPGGSWPAPGPHVDQAFAGEVMQLATIPADVHPDLGSTDLGVEEVLVGIAPYYQLEYGRYLVGMNTTSDQTFVLRSSDPGTARVLGEVPRGFHGDAGHVPLARGLSVPPQSTVVLYLNR